MARPLLTSLAAPSPVHELPDKQKKRHRGRPKARGAGHSISSSTDSADDGLLVKGKKTAPEENRTGGNISQKTAGRLTSSGQRSTEHDSGGSQAEDDKGQSVADGGNIDRAKPVLVRKKRKRVECWTIEQITSSKDKLLKELQSNRENLSKSRVKRLRARLALLTKAEQGEAQVGGQLAKAKKKKKTGAGGGLNGSGVQAGPKQRKGGEHMKYSAKHRDVRLSGSQKRKLQRICLRCREKGHLLDECPLENKDSRNGAEKGSEASMCGICFNCGACDHTLKNCRQKRRADGSLPFALCFVCGEKGHLSADCPKSTTGKYPEGGSCRTCGSIHHLQADCPQSRKQQKNPRGNGLKQTDHECRNRNYRTSQTGHSAFAVSQKGRKEERSQSGDAAGECVDRKTRRIKTEVDPDEYWMHQTG